MRLSPFVACSIVCVVAACSSPPPAVAPEIAEPPAAVPSAQAVPEPAAPTAAPPAAPTATASAPPPTTRPTPKTMLGYTRVWVGKTAGWNHAVAILKSGDVVAIDSSKITVHARHDGTVLESGRICTSGSVDFDSLHVRASGNLLVVCGDAVHEVKLPGLAHREVLSLAKDRANRCAFGPGLLATGHDDGLVIEYDTKTWKEKRRHKPATKAKVKSLAYSPDGKRLALSDEKGVFVIEGGKRTKVTGFVRDSGALGMSPDGIKIFGETKTFRAGEVNTKDGFIRGDVSISSWINTVRYVHKDLVAVAGAHGLALVTLASPKLVKLDGNAGEGLAVSNSGSMICAGGRSDRLVCFAKGKIAESTYKVSAKPAPTPKSSSTSTNIKVTGTLTSKIGKTVIMTLDADATVKVGATGQLQRKIKQNLGGLRFTANLVIADVTVTKVSGRRITLRIDAEKAKIVMNNKRVNHFKRGVSLTLTLK